MCSPLIRSSRTTILDSNDIPRILFMLVEHILAEWQTLPPKKLKIYELIWTSNNDMSKDVRNPMTASTDWDKLPYICSLIRAFADSMWHMWIVDHPNIIYQLLKADAEAYQGSLQDFLLKEVFLVWWLTWHNIPQE